MYTFKLEYPNGETLIVEEKSIKDLIKKYNLATKENAKVIITQL
jgi:hypothetical protein